jgi:spermidine/putrescine transport system substrate-binding protein
MTGPAFDRGSLAPFTRRSFLRGAGGATAAALLGPILAACSKEENGGYGGEPAGVVHVANWGLYLDRAQDQDGNMIRPSLFRFTDETGIQVDYREVIADAEAFYQQIAPYLASDRPTGWDVMVITNGVTMTKLQQLEYLVPLDTTARPNFDLNVAKPFLDPGYDPGARFSMPWQSGMTGLAYNPSLTGRPLTSLQELFSEEWAGKVGMFGDAVDLPNLTMISQGIAPETSTPDDWKAAAEVLRKQRADGIVNRSFRQNYVQALTNGDVALSMAWSGDIFQANKIGAEEGLQFVIPDEGAILWTDAMVIPKGAEHLVDAMKFMDFVFKPEIAALIAAYVNYVTPVPKAQDVLRDMAEHEEDPAIAQDLQAVANGALVFPSEEDLAALSTYRQLESDEEITAWNDTFSEFYA